MFAVNYLATSNHCCVLEDILTELTALAQMFQTKSFEKSDKFRNPLILFVSIGARCGQVVGFGKFVGFRL